MMMMMAADSMFCPSCFSFALRPGNFFWLLWDFVRHALFHGGFTNSKRELIFRINAETAKATQIDDFWSVAGHFDVRNMKKLFDLACMVSRVATRYGRFV